MMKDLTKKRDYLDTKCKVADAIGVNAEDYKLVLTRKKDNVIIPNFVMVMQDFAKYSLENCLLKSTYQVFFYFISILEYQNYVNVDIKTMAEKIKLSVASVNRSLKELKEAGVILSVKSENDKRRNDYFVNPFAMWRGRSSERRKCIKKLKENKEQLKLWGEFPKE